MGTRREPTVPPIFRAFLAAAAAVVGSGLEAFGFEHASMAVHGRECVVTYRRSGHVAVQVLYEPGGTPWLMLTFALPPGGDRPSFEAPLTTMVERRCPEARLSSLTMGAGGEQDLRRVLSEAVGVLRSHFGDALVADAETALGLRAEFA